MTRYPPVCCLGHLSTQFMQLKLDFAAPHRHKRMAKKPSVVILGGGTQMAARARHRNVRHTVQFRPHHLVKMAGDDILNAVLFCQLLQSKIRVLQHGVQNPRRPVRHNEFHRLRRFRQISFQIFKFRSRELLRSRVIQHGEMRRTFVETVMQSVPGMLLKQCLRKTGPDVVIARHQVQLQPPGRRDLTLHFQPFRLRFRIIQPLDRVAYIDHKIRFLTADFLPDLGIHRPLAFARPIPQNGEPRLRR